MSNDPISTAGMETATFGAGCFWCTEAVFRELKGVRSVRSGYSGGRFPNPTYREVCGGRSGHAEVVQLKFDPSLITFAQLVEVFFTTHDPTTPDRQGADVGTQYRSVIFYHNEGQRQTAEALKAGFAADVWDDPVVTEISPLINFYPAEADHQEYYSRNPYQPYCQIVISPKLKKFRKQYRELLRTGP